MNRRVLLCLLYRLVSVSVSLPDHGNVYKKLSPLITALIERGHRTDALVAGTHFAILWPLTFYIIC